MTESGIALCRVMSKIQIGKTASVGQWQCQHVLPGEGSQAVYQEATEDGIHYLRECITVHRSSSVRVAPLSGGLT